MADLDLGRRTEQCDHVDIGLLGLIELLGLLVCLVASTINVITS